MKGTEERIPSDNTVISLMFQTLSRIFETINQEVQSSIDATYSTGLTGSLDNGEHSECFTHEDEQLIHRISKK